MGQENAAATYEATSEHDLILENMVHQGQWMGRGPRSVAPDGTQMDERTAGMDSGSMVVIRTLPASAGTGSFALDGRNGITTYTVLGLANVDGVPLLSYTHQGQHATLAAPFATAVKFYVPDTFPSIAISLVNQGQTLVGATLYDADGEERATVGTGSGQDVGGEIGDATPGMWTLELEGSANGQFVVTVMPLDVEMTTISWDISP